MSQVLPSKQFFKRVGAIVIIALILLAVIKTTTYFKNKSGINNDRVESKITVGEIIQKDTNHNGIADWEEVLWGFDPSKNGPENKEAILAKKAELAKANPDGTSDAGDAITKNEQLSRDFFALIMSLQDSGNLNEASLNDAVGAIGSKVQATPIANKYSGANQTFTKSSTKQDITAYLQKIKTLLEKHKDLGDELVYVSAGLENRDPNAFTFAEGAASSYETLAKDMVKIPVPKDIADIMLSMANNYDKMGQSTEGLAKSFDDPLLGMRSLINYKKYSDLLGTDMSNLSKKI
jgi:hypothetical protein